MFYDENFQIYGIVSSTHYQFLRLGACILQVYIGMAEQVVGWHPLGLVKIILLQIFGNMVS